MMYLVYIGDKIFFSSNLLSSPSYGLSFPPKNVCFYTVGDQSSDMPPVLCGELVLLFDWNK